MKLFKKEIKPNKLPTPEDKLRNQIDKYKGCKTRWPESRKSRNRLRSFCRKNMDWKFFFRKYKEARDQLIHVRMKGTTITQTILEAKKNVRLWNDDQL
jgi:hypothetical protein